MSIFLPLGQILKSLQTLGKQLKTLDVPPRGRRHLPISSIQEKEDTRSGRRPDHSEDRFVVHGARPRDQRLLVHGVVQTDRAVLGPHDHVGLVKRAEGDGLTGG